MLHLTQLIGEVGCVRRKQRSSWSNAKAERKGALGGAGLEERNGVLLPEITLAG